MKKVNRKKVAKRINTHMKVKQWGVAELAQATGLSQDGIYKVLRGDRGMSLDVAKTIADEFDITIGALVD